MLQIPEKQPSRAFTVRAAENATRLLARVIEWFADVPLLLLLIYFDAGVIGGVFWYVASQLLKHFSSFIAKASTMAGAIALLNAVANWPLMILLFWIFGSVVGGVLWTIACVVLNYYVLVWYKRSKEDWFGAEWLRARESLMEGWLGGMFKYFLETGKVLAFLVLSVFIDPIYGFIQYRGKVTGPGFTITDWGWFAAANIAGVLPWLVLGITVSELIRTLW